MTEDFENQEIKKAYELVTKLIQESQSDAIQWSQDTGVSTPNSDCYHTFVAGKEILIYSKDGDGRHPYLFVLLDNDDVLLHLDTSDLYASLPEGWQARVGDLYTEARTRGRKANQAIDEIFDALDSAKARRTEDDIPF